MAGLMQAFQEACGEFPAFRAAVVQARDLADAGTRQQLDHLLNSLDKAFADVEQTFPQAVADLQQSLTRTDQQANQVLADVADMEKELATQQAEAAAAAARVPVPAPAVAAPAPSLPTMAPLDLLGGLRARDELLKRFGIPSPVHAHDVGDEGSVAAHWVGTDESKPPPSKPAVKDEWPEELRTPSSKKPSTTIRPKPPPRPASDDESIGKSWEDEGDS